MSRGRSPAASSSVAGKAEVAAESTDDGVVVFGETAASFAAARFPTDSTTAAAAATSVLAAAAAETAALGGSVGFLGASAEVGHDLRGGDTGGVIDTVASRDSEAGGCDGDVFFPPFFERCLWWPWPELVLFLEEGEGRVFETAASPLERSSTDRSLSNAAAQVVIRSVRIRLAELVA